MRQTPVALLQIRHQSSESGRRQNWWIKMARREDNEAEATVGRKSKTMPTSALSVTLQHLLADLRPDGEGMTDGELLSRFLRGRDEDALAALVRRHAPMVWGVCRHLLRNTPDAEDAFQATFLVLVQKAARVPGHAVPNWLYGVARQTAVRVRATAAKRGRRETQVADMPEPAMPEPAMPGVRDADSQSVVDEELSRLPGHYRGVVVLCDLEGMTRKEAARQLGLPEGSVASRLARARALLAKRLDRRGVTFSGSVAAGSAVSAPPSLVASTIKAASLLAAGRAAGVVSVKVAALTEGVVKAMFVSKIKGVLAAVLVVVALFGATGLVCRSQAGEEPKAEKKADEKKGEQAKTDLEKLQGKWQLVARTKDGRKQFIVSNLLEGGYGAEMLTVKGSSLLLSESDGSTLTRFRVDEAKSPKAIDMLPVTGEKLLDVTDIAAFYKQLDKQLEKGSEYGMRAIYQIDGDTLTLCMYQRGFQYGYQMEGFRPAKFESKEKSGVIIQIYERAKSSSSKIGIFW